MEASWGETLLVHDKEYEFLGEVPLRRGGIVDAFAHGINLAELEQDLERFLAAVVPQARHIVLHTPYISQLQVGGQLLLVVLMR